MFQKYRSMSDDEIVFEYKKTHQDDLENEIISRYKKHSKLLAGVLFNKFKFLYQVEFDDIYCILLGSVFMAIKGFNSEKTDFYHYWKTSSTNEALAYISKFSQIKNDKVEAGVSLSDEITLTGYLRQRNDNLKDDLSSFELDEVLSNPRNRISEVDKELFKLYVQGYMISEVAKLTGLDYNFARYRIQYVKKRLTNILFNK